MQRFSPPGVGAALSTATKGSTWALLVMFASVLGVVPVAVADDGDYTTFKVTTRDGGVPVIYNEGTEYYQRRTAQRRLSVPDPQIAGWIDQWSDARDLDPVLVQAVIQAESGYNPRALSVKGARGLMQLMPETAEELGVEDAWDPESNIRGGTAYLGRLLAQFGTLELALAAYNAGPGAVTRHGGVPPFRETRNYIRRVIRYYLGTDASADLDVRVGEERGGKKPQFVRRPGERPLLTTEAPD